MRYVKCSCTHTHTRTHTHTDRLAYRGTTGDNDNHTEIPPGPW